MKKRILKTTKTGKVPDQHELRRSYTLIALLALSAWPGIARAGEVPDKVLLDFNMKTPPPKDWQVEGYAFGTHQPNPQERQKAAVASRNQRYGRTGRMTSPEFVIDSDYLQVTCAGTFHPMRRGRGAGCGW